MEEKNELKAEEAQQEEQAVQPTEPAVQPETNKLVKIEKPDYSEESYDKVVERERATLFAAYSKSKKISNIITVVVLIVGLAGVILITQQKLVMTIIGWCLMGATVLGMLVYYFINKNKFPDRTRDYIKLITRSFNENTYKDEKYTDVFTNPEEKFDVAEVIGDGVYSDVALAQSRNVVRGKFDGKDFTCAEVALFKQQATRSKKEGPMFVGRYACFPNNLEMKGRLVINIKKTEAPLDVPTGVQDLTQLVDQPNLAVYGLKETDHERILGKKFYANFLEQLALKDHLINVNLVVWAGKTAVYFSYDDGAMGLPFDKPFEKAAQEQMADNLLDALELFNKIGK